jgi:hypothetical protein
MNVIEALRRGFDRAGFEADRLMRYNRVKAEALRLNDQIKKQTQQLGERALELFNEGSLLDPKIVEVAGQISELKRKVQAKEEEAAAINAEVWPEPEPEPAEAASPQAAAPAAPSTDTTPPLAAPTTPPVAASKVYCQNCGTEQRPGAIFCSRCGVRVESQS